MRWLIFFTLAIWFYLLAVVVTRRRRRVAGRLSDWVFEGAVKRRRVQPVVRVPLWHRVFGALSTSWVQRWPRQRIDKIQLRLQRAHSRWSVGEWVSLQLGVLGTGVILAAALASAAHFSLKMMAAGAAIVLLSWILPDFFLSRRITQRQELLRRQLPGTLDLLTVSVEAGLGFDQAMSRVAEESKPPMSEETQRILHEMQLGTPRMQALQRFGDRTDVPEIQLFVSAVVQADKLGIGMAKVLRIQAEDVRRKQRDMAHEKAAKAPVKILFPLILFIFPAMFVVILGPAALNIIHMFQSGKF